MNSSGLIRPVSTFLFLLFAFKTYISLATGYIQSVQGTRQMKSFIKLWPTWWIVIYKLTPSELSLCSQRKKPSFCPPVKSTESKVCVYKSRDRKRFQDGAPFLESFKSGTLKSQNLLIWVWLEFSYLWHPPRGNEWCNGKRTRLLRWRPEFDSRHSQKQKLQYYSDFFLPLGIRW